MCCFFSHNAVQSALSMSSDDDCLTKETRSKVWTVGKGWSEGKGWNTSGKGWEQQRPAGMNNLERDSKQCDVLVMETSNQE